MTAALAVHGVVADPAANLATLERLAHAAADGGAGLVVFSESALTGFVGTDDPARERPLEQTRPQGPAEPCGTGRTGEGDHHRAPLPHR